ncbi:MAG: glycosyltransferase family 2 protein [Eubacteriales bacterium]|nr:glycosyltransferase family 2 protein [Eubacteriales bacterium]
MNINTEEKNTDRPNKEKSDVLLIIPAYNEAGNIERVVDELISDYPQFDYVVVTDGPTDGTDRICAYRGYNTVNLPQNMGLAMCFHNGMQYAARMDYKYAVQFDGDGQHRPEYIEAMKKKADEGYDIVMGSRFIGLENDMSPMRSLGSYIIKTAILLKTGARVTDPTCGLRLYDRKLIRLFAERTDLAPEPDTVARLIRHGARAAEVPVKVSERENGESYLRPLKAAKYMYRMITAILFEK